MFVLSFCHMRKKTNQQPSAWMCTAQLALVSASMSHIRPPSTKGFHHRVEAEIRCVQRKACKHTRLSPCIPPRGAAVILQPCSAPTEFGLQQQGERSTLAVELHPGRDCMCHNRPLVGSQKSACLTFVYLHRNITYIK